LVLTVKVLPERLHAGIRIAHGLRRSI